MEILKTQKRYQKFFRLLKPKNFTHIKDLRACIDSRKSKISKDSEISRLVSKVRRNSGHISGPQDPKDPLNSRHFKELRNPRRSEIAEILVETEILDNKNISRILIRETVDFRDYKNITDNTKKF